MERAIPVRRLPVSRDIQEPTFNAVIPTLSSPCIAPTRRSVPSRSLQSAKPATAEPTAPIKPNTNVRSAPRAIPSSSLNNQATSRSVVAVQEPMGTSVNAGCKGCPNHVPFSRSLSLRLGSPGCPKNCNSQPWIGLASLSSQVWLSTNSPMACRRGGLGGGVSVQLLFSPVTTSEVIDRVPF